MMNKDQKQGKIKRLVILGGLIFGDKVIHIASGSLISTITIVSKNSLITKSITKYLTKEFEKRYGKLLENIGDAPLNRRDFEDFDQVFEVVRKYLPL